MSLALSSTIRKTRAVKWSPLGNEALIVECHAPAEFAKQLRDTRPSECLDVVSSYRHLAVYFSPADSEVIQEWLSKQTPSENSTLPRQHQIPVWYDQDWLTEFSDELSLSIEEIISLHSSATYTVAALGFSPGFPYLTGLPKKLQLPRKDTPARLPAGTVAIAADQAGIYPNDSFGGWHPLGLTDAPLFNPDQSPHSLLEPSDELTFLPVADKPSPVTRPSAQENSSSPTLTIESAGPATSIQDPGRPGHRHLGITSGGCADPEMATALNLLLGNQQEAPVLEFALEAPVIRFAKPTSFAFLGPQHPQAGRVINIRAGQVLDLKNSAMQSSFGVLAIKSGFDVPKLLKSAATDIRGSFGGKLIQKGDSLRHRVVEDYHKSNGNSHSPAIRWPLMSSNSLTVRILSGEHSDWFP
ncbi:allophanate hydrolase subunit 1, partial [Akkermansiaceae bacterium]|nr:allophanate hydrolase subunit 1 [Akkermansiaceae bacterium]